MEQLSEPVASPEDGRSQPTAPDICLRGVRKSYGDVVAVDGIDLEVANGEFFTMLGPSGSGKTTTLRMIAGLRASRFRDGRARRARRRRPRRL